MWFLAGVRMYVCVCVCVRFSMFQTPITHKRLEISIWCIDTPVKQSQLFNRDYFYDNWCRIFDFVGFWIFWKKDAVVLTFVKFDLSIQAFKFFVIFDTKFCKNWSRALNFRRIWFFNLFIVTSNHKNSMYPPSFLCEETEIKQRTFLKKELCEIGEEAVWESRFTSFVF